MQRKIVCFGSFAAAVVSSFLSAVVVVGAVRFDSPTRIECTDLESYNVSDLLDNCTTFEEINPKLCSFFWGPSCEGVATFYNCDHDETSGNIRTVRFNYIPKTSRCSGGFAQCGDTCRGESGKSFLGGPTDILCPAGSSCTYHIPGTDEENWTKTVSHANGSTSYSIKTIGISAVCDDPCSGSSSSWNNPLLSAALLLLSTFGAMLLFIGQ